MLALLSTWLGERATEHWDPQKDSEITPRLRIIASEEGDEPPPGPIIIEAAGTPAGEAVWSAPARAASNPVLNDHLAAEFALGAADLPEATRQAEELWFRAASEAGVLALARVSLTA